MAGTIYCLPNLIADGTLEAAIPPAVRTRAADIRLFFVEAAKNARAYLKLLGHPGPISELRIEEIGHDPDPALIDRWLEPVLARMPRSSASRAVPALRIRAHRSLQGPRSLACASCRGSAPRRFS